METELKLAISPSDANRVMRHGRLDHLVARGRVTSQLTARYVDTADCDLHAAGIALRVRKHGGVWTQTLKLDGGSAGALERGEWETPLADANPDLDAIRRAAGLPSWVRHLLRDIQRGGELQEKFVVKVKRASWQLRIADSEIDMALDEGSINCGSARAPVSEIELELTSGDKAALYAVAAELAGHVQVHVSDQAKSTRGYALCLGKPDGPRKAGTISLAKQVSVDEGMHAILGNCLHHAQANARGILDTDDPEYLHQMRVGLRRFRSAMKLFARWAVLPPAMQEEIDWLGGVLGSARDHDVLLHSTLPAMLEDISGDEDLHPLEVRAATAAVEERDKVRHALRSPRYGQSMLALFGWVDCGRWRDGMSADLLASLNDPLSQFARDAVEQGHAKIVKRGRNLHRHDSQALHRLRIACKRNRYAVEFFKDIERTKAAREYVKTLSSLQDILGMRNDLTVAMRIMHELQAEVGTPAAFASGYLSCRANAGLHDVREPWKRYSTLSPAGLFR